MPDATGHPKRVAAMGRGETSQIEVGLAEAKRPIGSDDPHTPGMMGRPNLRTPHDLAACRARSFIAVASPRPAVRTQNSRHLDERPPPIGRARQLAHADGSVVIEGEHQAVQAGTRSVETQRHILRKGEERSTVGDVGAAGLVQLVDKVPMTF